SKRRRLTANRNSFVEREHEQREPGHDGHVLPIADAIADRTAVDGRSEIRFPQQRSGARIQSLEIPFTSAREQQIRSGRQDAAIGHVCHRVFPLLPPRRRVERDHCAVTGRLGPRVDWRPPETGRPGYWRIVPWAAADEV